MATTITRQELNFLLTPAPTDTWRPLPHWYIAEQVENTLEALNVTPAERRLEINKTGTQVFATYKLQPTACANHAFEIGWRNSIDKTFSFQCVLGARVLVCSNLAFHGDWFHARRKHTAGFSLEDVEKMICTGIDSALNRRDSLNEWFEWLRNTPISSPRFEAELVNFVRTGVIPPTKLLEADKLFTEERQAYGNTLWALHNAVTGSWRGTGLATVAQRSAILNKRLRDLISETVEVDYDVE